MSAEEIKHTKIYQMSMDYRYWEHAGNGKRSAALFLRAYRDYGPVYRVNVSDENRL